MMVTWGRVSNHSLRLSCCSCTHLWIKRVGNLPTNPFHCYWLHVLGDKGRLKEAWSSCQLSFAIALISMVTKALHNCNEIHIILILIERGLHQECREWKKRKSKDIVIFHVILLKQNLLLIFTHFLVNCQKEILHSSLTHLNMAILNILSISENLCLQLFRRYSYIGSITSNEKGVVIFNTYVCSR